MDYVVPFKLILAAILGGFIGLEREYQKDERSKSTTELTNAGVRTFSLLALLGAISGLFIGSYPLFAAIISITVGIVLVTNYVLNTLHTKDPGMTTEIAGILAHVIGIVLAVELFPQMLAIAVTVIATLILSRKEDIKAVVARIYKFETNAFVTYAMIALVILPFLPNRSITLADIPILSSLATAYGIHFGTIASVELINPYKLWFIVTLITGVDLLGYFLNKYIGTKKGYVLSAISGGFISSTATTIALAQASKRTKGVDRLVGAAIAANTASFFQLIVLLAATDSNLLVESTFPILGIIITGCIGVLVFLRRNTQETKMVVQKNVKKRVFSLSQALIFGLLYVLIRFGSGIALVFFGNSGIYVTSAIGALIGIDAVTLNLADLTSRNVLALSSGMIALLLANAVNLCAKVFYSFTQGSREFTIKFSISVAAIILISILAVIIETII